MSMFTTQDTELMHIALDLAWQGRFSSSPNPRVGCVIVQRGQIVGQGFHVQAGGPHAEIHALNQAGTLAQGATAYVTLEPCSHTGRTGPCAQALVKAGITRVVAAMQDPNPLVGGQGFAMLRAAGIDVQSGLLATQARALNRGFLSRIERNRPFIRLKMATSLDGKIALRNGHSQWITGSAARHDVQVLRAESCAVLTGIGTVLADDPLLNVRAVHTLRQPARIVLDAQGRIPPNCRLMQDPNSPTILVHSASLPPRSHMPAHVSILNTNTTADNRIDLANLLPLLAQQGYGEMMVEAGARLNSAFLQQGWVDEIILYQAPKILGSPAQSALHLPENPHALNEQGWRTCSISQLGNDIKWVLTPN